MHGDFLKKSELPVKTCLTCGHPFSWRKKWSRCWEEVRYCSERKNTRADSFFIRIFTHLAGKEDPPTIAYLDALASPVLQ